MVWLVLVRAFAEKNAGATARARWRPHLEDW